MPEAKGIGRLVYLHMELSAPIKNLEPRIHRIFKMHSSAFSGAPRTPLKTGTAQLKSSPSSPRKAIATNTEEKAREALLLQGK